MGYDNGRAIRSHVDVVDLLHIADMDESYGTYADDEYLDNHDYDDNDDDNDHEKDSYTDAGAAPYMARPGPAPRGSASASVLPGDPYEFIHIDVLTWFS